MRTFEQTHPWLTFALDVNRFPARLWMLLGEAQSKARHVAGVPLLPDVARRLHEVFLARGAQATLAIEGNTLTEEQAQAHLQGRLTLPPSQTYLQRELENILSAFNAIDTQVFRKPPSAVSVEDLLRYNALVLDGVSLPDEVTPGTLRQHAVRVGGYPGAPAEDLAFLLDRLCAWLSEGLAPASEDDRIAFGLLRAVLGHLYLAWIHPFGDGNGRTARLLEYRLLVEAGVSVNAAQLLSNHYNQTRTEYYRQLDAASRSGGNVLPFIEYALQGFIEGLREQVQVIQAQQLRVHWVNFVHEKFRDLTGLTSQRQKHLALDLSEREAPVPFEQIRRVSIRMAEAYAGKTNKTVRRDVNALLAMGLVVVTPRGIRAQTEIVRAFLPPRVADE